MENKQLKVSAIKDGTVIDHIPSECLFKVIGILGLAKLSNAMTFGMNLESHKLGRKAIVKVADRTFTDEEVNKIAVVAPDAVLNIIRDYEVVEKRHVELPAEVRGFVRCFNPKCVTNHEAIATRFAVVGKTPIALRCHYCEKVTNAQHIEFIR